jgi:hypothetical protein
MDTTKTTAERIAERYNDDGQCWHDSDGIHIEEACEAAGEASRDDECDATRYDFADGSALVVGGGGWVQPVTMVAGWARRMGRRQEDEMNRNITAAERYDDLVAEARDAINNLTAEVEALAAIDRPDWAHVGSLNDGVVDRLTEALSTVRELRRSAIIVSRRTR